MKTASVTPMALALGLFLTFSASLLSGCNTVKGAGQDIKSAGQAIEKTAEEAKP
jgi:predicted small secreted protein